MVLLCCGVFIWVVDLSVVYSCCVAYLLLYVICGPFGLGYILLLWGVNIWL